MSAAIMIIILMPLGLLGIFLSVVTARIFYEARINPPPRKIIVGSSSVFDELVPQEIRLKKEDKGSLLDSAVSKNYQEFKKDIINVLKSYGHKTPEYFVKDCEKALQKSTKDLYSKTERYKLLLDMVEKRLLGE